jgi:peptide/nickel transport system substrate-binding protein
MKRKGLWFLLILAISITLISACAPASPETTTTTKPTSTTTTAPPTTTTKSNTPQYGGVLRLSLAADITWGWDGVVTSFAVPGATYGITNDPIWWGDWAKGPAGGYGTNDTDWGGHFDLWPLMAGRAAKSWSWKVEADGTGTIIYNVREGVHYGLNQASEASRLVAGREMTADDVVFSLQRVAQDPRSYVAKSNPELKAATFTKTGPWEVTIKLPTNAMVAAICRLGMYGRIEPPEVVNKYGSLADWRNSVGTGPFMLVDYVPAGVVVLKKNPNYWGTDPVGPGKGNQLPYVDEVRYLIIPDASTREAAVRTAKLDQISYLPEQWESAELLKSGVPELKAIDATIPHGGEIQLRTDRPPFNDLKVRRAIMMATDFQTIHNSMNGGIGQIETWPFPKVKGYEDLYVNNSDPDVPESTRELYAYNPEKAKALLTEAGYPDGFEMTALVTNTTTEIDYYSILVDMWSKVNIKLILDVKEAGVVANIQRSHKQPEATIWGGSPVAIFYVPPTLYGTGANMSELNDKVILDSLAKMRLDAISDLHLAMKDMRELSIYLRGQAYHIPRAKRPPVNLWWPWVKNYSGESFVSYGTTASWAEWVWLDKDLKKQMGY